MEYKRGKIYIVLNRGNLSAVINMSDFVIEIDITLFCTTDFKAKNDWKGMIKHLSCCYVNL